MDWRTVRPKGKWVLAKADPRMKKSKGGIELPDMTLGVERVMEGTAHILRVGTDREGILDATGGVMLEAGMRFFFRGFLKDAFHEFEPDADGCTIFMIRAEDVMGIIDEDVQMGAFS